MNESGLEKIFIAGEGLSKEQASFQKRIKAIKKLKEEFEKLEVDITNSKSEVQKVILPLELQHFSLLKARILILEEVYLSQKLSKKVKKNLKEVIVRECECVLGIEDDQGIIEIYNRFSDKDYDETMDEMVDGFDGYMDDLFNDASSENHKKSEAKKSKKQLEREEKEKAREEAKKRSFKDIFRDLVKVFHPDTEKDEEKKKEKEEITKELNKAYKDNDLLAMLEMELRLINTNSERIKQLATDKLKVYNEILLAQKKQLEENIFSLKFQNEFIYRTMCTKNADKRKVISQLKSTWTSKIRNLKSENEHLQTDTDYLKSFLEIYLDDLKEDFFL